MANFVNKLKRGNGKYKGKIPLKCFGCDKIGNVATKCLLKNSSEYNLNQRRERYRKKNSCFTEIGSDSSEDDEEYENGINEILFMDFEYKYNQEVKYGQGVANLEAKLMAALEEIENFSKHIDMKSIQLAEENESEKKLTKKTSEKEEKIKALQD